MTCLLKHKEFREGLWHSSECPFISQSFHFEPKLPVSLFQIVKYAIQSFISCQDGNLDKHRYLNTPKGWWENGSVSVYWLEKVCVCFRVFSQWYRTVKADRHGHILGLYYSSCTRVKCFHCMRSVLTEGQKTCPNSFTPTFLSLSFCPLVSHVHRWLKSEQKAALQSSLDSEPSWWSFILLFGAPLCPLVLVLCVWECLLFANQWKVCHVGRSSFMAADRMCESEYTRRFVFNRWLMQNI